jgi:predicted dehydrogenase
MTAPLRIGVVGAGNFAQRHLEAYARQDGVTVVAVADIDRARAKAVAAEWGIEQWFGDGSALIAACSPDGVSVVTPGTQHREPTLAALAAGCGVLLEKPVATTSSEVAVIEAAGRVSSGFVMPGHILRFAAPHAELQARVREGSLGQVLGISAVRDRGRDHERLFPDLHPALMTTIHDIDLALWISDSRAVRVSAHERGGRAGGPPLLVWAHVEAADGGVWSLRESWLLPDGAPTADRLEVYGTQGTAALDLTGAGDATVAAIDAEIAHFCHCLRTGAEPSVTLADAAHGVLIAEAIIASAAAGGTPVDVAV